MEKELKLKKKFELDEIDMKWEDEIFPEEKMLGSLFPEEGKLKKRQKI